MVLAIVSIHFLFPNKNFMFLIVAAPASVIGIGGDHSNLSNDKDQYDHVMSPFHGKFFFPEKISHTKMSFFRR
jgi:hypothetical protein